VEDSDHDLNVAIDRAADRATKTPGNTGDLARSHGLSLAFLDPGLSKQMVQTTVVAATAFQLFANEIGVD